MRAPIRATPCESFHVAGVLVGFQLINVAYAAAAAVVRT